MIEFRSVLAAFALVLAAVTPAAAADPAELRIGLTVQETMGAAGAGVDAYQSYLERELGIPVRVFRASDYAGVAQAMEAGQIDLAPVGPSNYAAMHLVMGDAVAPIATIKEVDGSAGYFSILFVKSDSPFQTVDDFRGKTLAFSDVNSASGYLVPRYGLRKEGRDPDTFFGRTIFAGGHPQAVVAVLRGQADAGVTWSSMIGDPAEGYSRGIPRQMADAGQIKGSDIRVIWQYGPIPNGPLVIRTALPEAFRARVLQAHLDMKAKDPTAYGVYAQGTGDGMIAVGHEAYAEIVAMRQAEEAARRGR